MYVPLAGIYVPAYGMYVPANGTYDITGKKTLPLYNPGEKQRCKM
jgi:hypothetical protein